MFELSICLPKEELTVVQRYANQYGLTVKQAARILMSKAISAHVYESLELTNTVSLGAGLASLSPTGATVQSGEG
jgi:hypothetical protein